MYTYIVLREFIFHELQKYWIVKIDASLGVFYRMMIV